MSARHLAEAELVAEHAGHSPSVGMCTARYGGNFPDIRLSSMLTEAARSLYSLDVTHTRLHCYLPTLSRLQRSHRSSITATGRSNKDCDAMQRRKEINLLRAVFPLAGHPPPETSVGQYFRSLAEGVTVFG
jgi:hypothetical protein